MCEFVTIVGYASIGFVLSSVFYKLICIFTLHVLRRTANDKTNFTTRFGQWAVITGSTDGIGKAYATELAKRGMNIVLISRNNDKLKKVAQEMSDEYNVQTKTIMADFTDGLHIYERIKNDLQNLNVGILVNNVGVTQCSYFDEFTSKCLWQDVNININSMLQMTNMILPQMKKRRRGAIVNVCSSVSEIPLPVISLHSASKVYIKYFSLALQYECKSFGVTVQLLSPAFVRTKLNEFSATIQKHPQFMMPSAKVYARHAVKTLGVCDDTAGYFFHDIEYMILKLVPMKLKLYASLKIGRYLRNDFRRHNMSSIIS